MRKSIWKWRAQQGLNFQNIQTAHITQYQEEKKNHEMGRWPK